MTSDGLGPAAEESPVMEAARELAGQGGEGTLFGMTMWGLVAGLLFSGIGYLYYKRGREQGDSAKLGCGVALMLYPYFFTNTWYMVLIGAGLTAAPFVIERS